MNQTCRVAKKNKGRWICTKNTLLRHNLFDVLILVEEHSSRRHVVQFIGTEPQTKIVAGWRKNKSGPHPNIGLDGESYAQWRDAKEDKTLRQPTKKGKPALYISLCSATKPHHRHKSQLTERIIISVLKSYLSSHLPRNILIAELRSAQAKEAELFASLQWRDGWGGRKWEFFNGNKSVYVVGWSPPQMMMVIISLIRILNVIASCALQQPQCYLLLGKYDNECRSDDGRGLSDMARGPLTRAFHEH